MLWIASGWPASLLKHSPETPAGRFNAGQKLNFILITLLLAALFVSGIGLVITGSHPVNPVFKAAHVVAAYAALLLVAGHLYMAVINPSTRPALRGMVSGKVDAAWARKYHTRAGSGAEDASQDRAASALKPPYLRSSWRHRWGGWRCWFAGRWFDAGTRGLQNG
jgi:cytochrome b subunit of formate dehydrogenase